MVAYIEVVTVIYLGMVEQIVQGDIHLDCPHNSAFHTNRPLLIEVVYLFKANLVFYFLSVILSYRLQIINWHFECFA